MSRDVTLEAVRRKFELLRPLMTERMRRHWAACEALTLQRGGVILVAQATGLSRTTIWAGLRELRHPQDVTAADLPFQRSRHAGAGRPFLEEADPTLVKDLEALLEATTRGDPQSPLLWTCKSTRNLAEELSRQGHGVSYRTVAALLHDLDYSLQANRKTREGSSHPDRDAQFEHISRQVRAFQRAGQPVVSVDSKKRELVGDFKNGGQAWRPAGTPEEVRAKDFPDQRLGKVTPSGVYDLTYNEGWVSVGIDHNTSQFAAETIRRWWCEMGAPLYPDADRLLSRPMRGAPGSVRSRPMRGAPRGAPGSVLFSACAIKRSTGGSSVVRLRDEACGGCGTRRSARGIDRLIRPILERRTHGRGRMKAARKAFAALAWRNPASEAFCGAVSKKGSFNETAPTSMPTRTATCGQSMDQYSKEPVFR